MTRSRVRLAGADQRRFDLGMQGEVAGDDVHRLDEPGAGTRHVERVQWPRAEAPGDLSRGRRLERLAGDPAVDQKVDLGRIDAVLPKRQAVAARDANSPGDSVWSGST